MKAVLAEKNERKVRNIFQKYVPKSVIDSIFQNPEQMLVGQDRKLAIFFSDIRSFTTISEGYKPDELVKSLNRYFETAVDILINRGGIIDKYIGDAIMAFFGAPVSHRDDALQAVTAALEMQEAIREINNDLAKIGKPPFITGIGINYGIVTVGNIGSQKKMDYTIIGDNVNLGSRLEGLTKMYKQELIFSSSVYHQVKNTLPCRLVDSVVVKGKTKSEKIFTAKLELSEIEAEAWALHNMAMMSYYKRDFKAAYQTFRSVNDLLEGDHIANMFMERSERYMKNPPPADWDGTEVLTSK